MTATPARHGSTFAKQSRRFKARVCEDVEQYEKAYPSLVEAEADGRNPRPVLDKQVFSRRVISRFPLAERLGSVSDVHEDITMIFNTVTKTRSIGIGNSTLKKTVAGSEVNA